MRVWRLMTHHHHPKDMLSWAKSSQRLAIGWGLIGDLAVGHHTSRDSISAAIRRHYPRLANAPSGGQSLWDLWRTMRVRDLVILSTGERRAVMRVIGPYEYVARNPDFPVGDYRHQRQGELLDVDANQLWNRAGGRADGYNPYSTLIPCAREVSGF